MKKSKWTIGILVLVLSLSMLSGCKTDLDKGKVDDISPDTEDVVEEYGVSISRNTVSFIDGRGEELTIAKHPKRVIVLFNSLLDIWMRNGGGIVGRIEESAGQDPIPGIEDAELVGKLGTFSLEKIIELNPDLVILMSTQKSQMELVTSFEQNNIPYMALEYHVKEDYFKLARLFSAINDREDLYKENVLDVSESIDEIIEKAPKDREYKALLMMASAKSVTARNSDSTVGEMLKDLKVVNIADDSNNALSTKNFSIEKILEEDPGFIFVQTTGSDMDKVMERMKEDVESNPAWSTLSAVKGNRYIILPKDLYMFKPNHRYAEAYEGLAKILYPEIFK